MSSSEEEEKFTIPEYPSRKEIKQMIKSGLVSPNTVCKFSYLYKGEWTYTFKVGDRTCKIIGGEATYEAAYYLELEGTYSLEYMMGIMGRDYW